MLGRQLVELYKHEKNASHYTTVLGCFEGSSFTLTPTRSIVILIARSNSVNGTSEDLRLAIITTSHPLDTLILENVLRMRRFRRFLVTAFPTRLLTANPTLK